MGVLIAARSERPLKRLRQQQQQQQQCTGKLQWNHVERQCSETAIVAVYIGPPPPWLITVQLIFLLPDATAGATSQHTVALSLLYTRQLPVPVHTHQTLPAASNTLWTSLHPYNCFQSPRQPQPLGPKMY
jgi:hypothetical protein